MAIFQRPRGTCSLCKIFDYKIKDNTRYFDNFVSSDAKSSHKTTRDTYISFKTKAAFSKLLLRGLTYISLLLFSSWIALLFKILR